MSVSAKATICLKFIDEKQITALISALAPETQAMPTKRANVKLLKDGLFLVLSAEAEDTIALRATLNAYLRWINSTANVISVIDHPQTSK
jgi:tRNA threonylcarbamoyladenosine modification (KEOPS) complex  Pcc1 subunit